MVTAYSYDVKDEHLILGLESYEVENGTSPSSSASIPDVYTTNLLHFDGIVRQRGVGLKLQSQLTLFLDFNEVN